MSTISLPHDSGGKSCCKIIERIPRGHGLMIMLHDDSSDAKSCNCLKLQSQHDSNLDSIHPNIYIPTPLTSYPKHLKRYSGGGSGVTVFGGYHPQLGSLVMKHGGYKDLIELVSLAKIEREVRVRGGWRIDCLKRRIDKIQKLKREIDSDEEMEECGDGFAATYHNEAFVTKESLNNANGKKFGASVHSVPTSSTTTSSNNRSKLTRPLYKMNQTMRNIFKLPSSTTLNLHHIQRLNTQIDQITHAMTQIQKRIPQFKMIYISPMHLREREEELANSGFRAMKRRHAFKSTMHLDVNSFKNIDKEEEEEEEVEKKLEKSMEYMCMNKSMRRTSRVITRRTSTLGRKGRDIHLFGAENLKMAKFDVEVDRVEVCFGGCYCHRKDVDIVNEEEEEEEESQVSQQQQQQQQHVCNVPTDGSDGYATLMTFVHQLQKHQKANEWKVTLAQQTIGTTFENGDINKPKSARTASSLLYEGKLQGKLLHHLIDEEIKMIKNMQLLTMPEEANVIEQVREEYNDILKRHRHDKGRVSASEVTDLMNDFVGKAIHKNFHPDHGRFVMLRQFGRDLRQNKVHLTEEEFVPAFHLENLFCNHFSDEDEFDVGEIRKVAGETFSLMTRDVPGPSDTMAEDNNADVASGNPKVIDRGVSSLTKSLHYRRSICEHPIFASGLSQWQSLLELSLSMKHPNTTKRVWTCGLTDGGLHNLFLGEDQLWAFDLGEPSLEPIPAFLTKFLMSFFHALGMEEDEKGDWVVRFEQAEGKLRPTEATKKLFPKIVHSFNITVDRLIKELFGGEEEVRTLLLRYVVTQLISDAAFCIEKWKIKGGGDESRSDHQTNLEKWLWRALWDVYASEELRRLYLTRLIMVKQRGSRDLVSDIE